MDTFETFDVTVKDGLTAGSVESSLPSTYDAFSVDLASNWDGSRRQSYVVMISRKRYTVAVLYCILLSCQVYVANMFTPLQLSPIRLNPELTNHSNALLEFGLVFNAPRMLSIFFWVQIICSLPLSWVSQRAPLHYCVIISASASLVAVWVRVLAAYLAWDLLDVSLLLSHILNCVACAWTEVLAPFLTIEWFPARERRDLMGLLILMRYAGVSLSNASALVILRFLNHLKFDKEAAQIFFIIVASLVTLSFVLTAVLFPCSDVKPPGYLLGTHKYSLFDGIRKADTPVRFLTMFIIVCLSIGGFNLFIFDTPNLFFYLHPLLTAEYALIVLPFLSIAGILFGKFVFELSNRILFLLFSFICGLIVVDVFFLISDLFSIPTLTSSVSDDIAMFTSSVSSVVMIALTPIMAELLVSFSEPLREESVQALFISASSIFPAIMLLVSPFTPWRNSGLAGLVAILLGVFISSALIPLLRLTKHEFRRTVIIVSQVHD